MSKISFIPSPVWRSSHTTGRWASHWSGDVMNISAAGFNLDFQVQWFKVRVLMSRVMNYPSVFYFIILVISLRHVAWVVNRLHRAKEHSMVDHFTEGGGGCAGYWKIALFRMFPLFFSFFFFQNIVALFSILNLWCRFYHLVPKEVVFFQEKNQAIMNVFLLLDFRTCYLPMFSFRR